MRIFSLSLLLIVTCLQTAAGQGYRADRPQFTKSGYVLPVKTFAIESGSSAAIVDADRYVFNHVGINVRIGLMRLMEMVVGINVPAVLDRSGTGNHYTAGFASPNIGLKVVMKEKEEGKRMAMAFYGEAGLNVGSKEFKDTKILPAFRVSMDIDWNERTNMQVNYGIVWLESEELFDPEGDPVIDPYISAGISVSGRVLEKLTVFGEGFLQVKHDNFRSGYYAGGGWIVHLRDNLQLDFSASAGLSPESARGLLQIGISGLMPRKNVPWMDGE